MRKTSNRFIFSLLAFILVAGIAFAATPGYRSSPGTGDIMGQGKYQSDPHKIFRMVRYIPRTYSGAIALSADSIVIWDLTSDDGVTITTTSTSYDSAVAGIIVQNALTPDAVCCNSAADDRGKRNWTWLQTYGLSQVNVTPNTAVVSAGAALAASAVAGEAVPFIGGGTASTTQGMAGFFYDAAAAGADDVEVFLNID